jgi:hypothetical protein
VEGTLSRPRLLFRPAGFLTNFFEKLPLENSPTEGDSNGPQPEWNGTNWKL